MAIDRYDEADRLPATEFHAGIIAPAAVNAHCHLELSHLRGKVARGGGFAGFARGLRAVRACDAATRTKAVADADAEMAAEGVALCGDIANEETAFDVKRSSKVEYRTFAEAYGLRTQSTEAVRRLLRHRATTLTPHSTYSLNDRLFREICNEGDAPLSIHFMETPEESALFERRGAMAEWYAAEGFECDFLHYGSPAKRLVECVPPWRSVLLVHCRCVTQRDIDMIMEHFTAPVYWVLCPQSNLYISGALPPVELLRRNRLDICLGTDSAASNERLSPAAEMRCFADVPIDEQLRWATCNGARALGTGERLGTIAEGRAPGLVAVSGVDYATMTPTDALRIERIA